jgi:hypothetical protein
MIQSALDDVIRRHFGSSGFHWHKSDGTWSAFYRARGTMASLLHVSVLQDGGSMRKTTLMSWTDRGTNHLRWSLYDLMRTAGYKETASSRYWGLWRTQKKKWHQWLDLCGIEAANVTGDSEAQVLGQSASAASLADPMVEKECWLSTCVVPNLLAWWIVHRRSNDYKLEVRRALETFLASTVQGSVADDLLDRQPLPEEATLCSTEPVVNGVCVCMRGIIENALFQNVEHSPQQLCASFLEELLMQSNCGCALAVARRVSTGLADDIESHRNSWGKSDLTKESDAWLHGFSGVKRRRANPHLKQQCVLDGDRTAPEIARSSGLQKSNAGTAKGWVTNWLSGMRGTCLVSSDQFSGTLSSCFDAARLGRPAKDYNVHLLWDHSRRELQCPPPKVSYRHEVTIPSQT